MNKEELVKEQIKTMCRIFKIKTNEEFIEYVYNLKLPYFSGYELEKLRKEYNSKKG